MSIFDDLMHNKEVTEEDKEIAYERCKHLFEPKEDYDGPLDEIDNTKFDECIRVQTGILYYSRIQHLCIKSGEYIEDDRYVGLEHHRWINCWKEDPTTEEYIAAHGFDPHTTCFHCETDDQGKMIDEREICNPCHPCINFTYDGDCTKWQYWYLIFDAKACRYWRQPTSKEVMWNCEEQAIRAWESDIPPVSAAKQQISFYDPEKRKGDFCPKDRHRVTGDLEIDKNIPKTPNDFRWCVPTWNDQCRFYVIQFRHNMSDITDQTITTQWKFLKKCNQEECDLAEEFREGSSMGPLARHANLCIQRCYQVAERFAIYPEWQYDLLNYRHNEW